MPNLSKRSTKLELLDGDNIPYDDLAQNLKELEIINRFLGGHSITIKGLQHLIAEKNREYTILDIGSGGGDTLKAMAKFGRKNSLKLKLIGVDLKEEAIMYSSQNCKNFLEISFIQADYREIERFNITPDIIVSSLFCHHLTDLQLIEFFSWMNAKAKIGFLINDLHRNALAYKSISLLTTIFSKSYLVKNDARLSVARGFNKSELQSLLNKASISHFYINWMWAFRWLIIVKTT